MKIYRLAGELTAWRGFKYYEQKKVLNCKRVGPGVYEGVVSGNGSEPYMVTIDANSRYACTCTCPFADTRGKICKHMIALSFQAEPEDAELYFNEYAKPMLEKELRREQQEYALMEYIAGLDKLETQRILLSLLLDGPEDQFIRFMRENLDIDPSASV